MDPSILSTLSEVGGAAAASLCRLLAMGLVGEPSKGPRVTPRMVVVPSGFLCVDMIQLCVKFTRHSLFT